MYYQIDFRDHIFSEEEVRNADVMTFVDVNSKFLRKVYDSYEKKYLDCFTDYFSFEGRENIDMETQPSHSPEK